MNYQFETSKNPTLPIERASVLFDGMFSKPKLSHPEGVAIGTDDWIWAGTQDGDICRIAPDGSTMEHVSTTNGFALGLIFHGEDSLFICDLKHAAVFKLDLKSKTMDRFTKPGIKIPNYPLVDRKRKVLFVSDSHEVGKPGPGVWAYDLTTGDGNLWCDRVFNFANGLAMGDGGSEIYVCETFAPSITRVPINPDGSAGNATKFAVDLPGLPDGIALDCKGNLVVGCYEPSRLLRISPDGKNVEILIEDPAAHMFCHPTNIAFSGNSLYTANLGRWHLTSVEMDIGAEPLWKET